MTSTPDKIAATIAKTTKRDIFVTGTLTRRTSGTFDPVLGRMTGSTEATLPCRGVFSSIRVTSDSGMTQKVAGVTLDVEPQIGDVVTIGEVSATITSIKRVAPFGTALLWKAVIE